MIVDSSALIAVFEREPGYDAIVDAMAAADTIAVSAPTAVEVGIVVSARIRGNGDVIVNRFLRDYGIAVLAFSDEHWRTAVAAYVRFGKGSKHRAKLNFGACMSYATAKLARQPLLFVGNDFRHTDVVAALPSS